MIITIVPPLFQETAWFGFAPSGIQLYRGHTYVRTADSNIFRITVMIKWFLFGNSSESVGAVGPRSTGKKGGKREKVGGGGGVEEEEGAAYGKR
jgi:hypothetical protein